MNDNLIQNLTKMKQEASYETVSNAELQSFIDNLLKSEGEDDVFIALDELSTNANKIINDLHGPALIRA